MFPYGVIAAKPDESQQSVSSPHFAFVFYFDWEYTFKSQLDGDDMQSSKANMFNTHFHNLYNKLQ